MATEDQLQLIVHRLRYELPEGSRSERDAALRARIDALTPEDRAVLDEFLGPLTALPGEDESDPATMWAKTLFPQLDDKTQVPTAFADFDSFQTKFETWLDLKGWWTSADARLDWVGGNSPLNEQARALWKNHADPALQGERGFVYPLPDYPAAGAPLRLAVVGDFGMALGPAKWTAGQMNRWNPQVVIHLGDVYYAGTGAEFAESVDEHFAALRKTAAVWQIIGDHERFDAGGRGYAEALARNAAPQPGWHSQRQRSNYFALQNTDYQVLGIDGNAITWNRLPRDETSGPIAHRQQQRGWLRERLASAKGMSLLCSQSPPHYPSGKPWRKFGGDVRRTLAEGALLRNIHAWVYGDMHHAAVYRPRQSRPFVSMLAGHGAYPERRQKKASGAELLWREDCARYPDSWNPAPTFPPGSPSERHLARLRKRTRNGWVKFELYPGGGRIRVRYVDWLGYRRLMFEIHRDDSGAAGIPESSIVRYGDGIVDED